MATQMKIVYTLPKFISVLLMVIFIYEGQTSKHQSLLSFDIHLVVVLVLGSQNRCTNGFTESCAVGNYDFCVPLYPFSACTDIIYSFGNLRQILLIILNGLSLLVSSSIKLECISAYGT